MEYDTHAPPDRTHHQRMNIGIHIESYAILFNSVDERLKFLYDFSRSASRSMGCFCSAGIVQYRFW